MTEVAWTPHAEYVERANVTRLMRSNGIRDIDELRRRSVEDIEWYWDAVVKDLFTADGTWRRGKHGLMKQAADEAVAEAPSVERVIVLENLRADMPMTP